MLLYIKPIFYYHHGLYFPPISGILNITSPAPDQEYATVYRAYYHHWLYLLPVSEIMLYPPSSRVIQVTEETLKSTMGRGYDYAKEEEKTQGEEGGGGEGEGAGGEETNGASKPAAEE